MESELPMYTYFYWGGVTKNNMVFIPSLEKKNNLKFYLYRKLCVSFSIINRKNNVLQELEHSD